MKVRELQKLLTDFPRDATVLGSWATDYDHEAPMEISLVYKDPLKKIVWIDVDQEE